MSAPDPKRTWTGSSSRSAADLLGASVCATVGDGGTGVPMFAELHVPMTGQADRDDGCGTSGRREPEPRRSRLEVVRHLAAALGHHLLVQPQVHIRGAIEGAGVAKLLRQLLAGAKAAVMPPLKAAEVKCGW